MFVVLQPSQSHFFEVEHEIQAAKYFSPQILAEKNINLIKNGSCSSKLSVIIY